MSRYYKDYMYGGYRRTTSKRIVPRRKVVFLVHGMQFQGEDANSLWKLEKDFRDKGYQVIRVKWNDPGKTGWNRSWTLLDSRAGNYVWDVMGQQYLNYVTAGYEVTVIGHSNGARAVNWLAKQGRLDFSHNYAVNGGLNFKNASNVTHVSAVGDWLSFADWHALRSQDHVWLSDTGSQHSITQGEIDYFKRVS